MPLDFLCHTTRAVLLVVRFIFIIFCSDILLVFLRDTGSIPGSTGPGARTYACRGGEGVCVCALLLVLLPFMLLLVFAGWRQVTALSVLLKRIIVQVVVLLLLLLSFGIVASVGVGVVLPGSACSQRNRVNRAPVSNLAIPAGRKLTMFHIAQGCHCKD